MSWPGKRRMPVGIVTRAWSRGIACPTEVRIRMDNGCIRRYRLAEEEEQPKVTVEKVERVPEIRMTERQPCRLLESWMILQILQESTFGGNKGKDDGYSPKHSKRK